MRRKLADAAGFNTQAAESLAASELGAKILALREEKEKALGLQKVGVVPWLFGMA